MIPRGDKQFLETPWYGSRQMARHMKRNNQPCGRHCAHPLMRLMRLVPIYQEPNTSKRHPKHKIWPYLLRNVVIDRPNQVWCADITYFPLSADCFAIASRQWMRRGFLYLVAIRCPALVCLQTMSGLDWYSRKVLSWRLSNSMDAAFCVEALEEALAKHGKPEIFNTDQGSQFTSGNWIDVLTDAKINISMDGKGRWIDDRMIERLWRSLKYECVYVHAFETGSEAKAGIEKWLAYYNVERPHSTHGILTPDEAYASKTEPMRLAG
jgi:putative transposase